MEGRGIDHPFKGAPRKGCERESVPVWFSNARERLDFEARGFVERCERTYPMMMVDAAVSDALGAEMAIRQAEAREQERLDASARAKGAKSHAGLMETNRKRAIQMAAGVQVAN